LDTTNFWPLHEDFSVKSFEQIPHVCKSTEGEADILLLDLVIFSRLKPKDSLSKDHLSLLDVAMSSENACIDQLSDDPPREPLADSLLHEGSLALSSETEWLLGDLFPGIRPSDTCLNS
jgi:hypothetical protein